MKIILGSQSTGRKQVLTNAGYTFDIMTADIDEKSIRSDNYKELPLLLAQAKAAKLLPQITEDAILITSDQVVVCNNELREKPESEEEAYRYLRDYSAGSPAQTHTAVVVTNTKTGKQAEGVHTVQIYFHQIPENIIASLIKEGTIMKTAGGFMVEHPLLKPYVKQIDGPRDSVTGLPLKLTEELIKKVLET